MMRKISINMRESTARALGRRVRVYRRSQFLDYAALALLARVRGAVRDAEEYERCARELVRGEGA